jgi:hypothetical protein
MSSPNVDPAKEYFREQLECLTEAIKQLSNILAKHLV